MMERYFQDDNKMKTFLRVMPFVMALTACGGGGDNSNSTSANLKPTPPTVVTQCLTPKVLQSGVCVSVANICQTETEKTWVRAYLDDTYLWYNEIKDENAPRANYNTPQGYFNALLIKDKDKFSFTQSEEEVNDFYQSGINLGYGVKWVREGDYVRIAFVEPDSPAEKKGLKRGDYLWRVDGVNLWEMTDESYFDALYPSQKNVAHFFEIITRDGSQQVQLTANEIVSSPVPLTSTLTVNSKKIGYLVFNEHIATATTPLITAVKQFQNAKIDDLVLDLRYNSGGFLYVADELASMLGGSATFNRLFTYLEFNDKHPEKDEPYFFERTSYENGTVLPLLTLKRVFVLTSNMTCSASEAIINALSPFVEVIRIGSSTCGKPYGFHQENNCGSAYFAIDFQGKNALGQTVPTAGFAPTCAANEDLNNPLGNPMESMLSTALYYQEHGTCPITSLTQSAKIVQPRTVKEVYRAPWRSNMITNPPSSK